MKRRLRSKGSALFGGVSREQRGITGLETAIVLIAFVVVSSVFAFATLSTGLFSSDEAKKTIQAGLSEAQGTLEVKGVVIANATLTAVASETAQGNGVLTVFNLVNGPVVPGSVVIRIDEDDDGIYTDETPQVEGADYNVTYNTDPAVVTFSVAPLNDATDNNIEFAYTHYVVNTVVFQLANAAGGQAVDLTPGETIIAYQDADNLSTAITTFGLTWLGTNDGDNLLETDEVAQISITVTSFTLYQGKVFTIQVKPQQGAVVKIQRNIADNISAVMDLDTG